MFAPHEVRVRVNQVLDNTAAHTCTSSCKKWPFFHRKSSFFRGNSPFILHFQHKNGKLAFILQFAVLKPRMSTGYPILPLSASRQ